MDKEISLSDLEKVDIRVGKIIDAQPFPEARKPSIKLVIDFGEEFGHKKSCAQLTRHYTPKQLVGRQVVCVVNLSPRQIGPVLSEVLTLGVPDPDGEPILLVPDKEVPIGGRMY